MKTIIYFEEEVPATMQMGKIASALYGALQGAVSRMGSIEPIFLRCWQVGRDKSGRVAARCTVGYQGKNSAIALGEKEIDTIEQAVETIEGRFDVIFATRKGYCNEAPWVEFYVSTREKEGRSSPASK